MKRTVAIIIAIFLCMGLIKILNVTDQGSAAGPTEVSGIISTDTTWTLTNSPYIVTGNVLVNPNINLTIDPGITVKFHDNRYLKIDGTLYANGTESQMVTFTSNNTTPAKGDWDGIIFATSSKMSVLKYCKIEYGKGIESYAHDLTVYSSLIENNTKDNGGGIYNFGNLSIMDTTIKDNYASLNWGGGIYNMGSASLIINNCEIINNSANYRGGAVYNTDSASINIADSKIFKNSADDDGGGVYIYNTGGASIKITGSELINNTSGDSGGGFGNRGPVALNIDIYDTIISGNSATSYVGGGIYINSLASAIVNIINCTITENYANNDGDGIYGSPIIKDSIISNNYGDGIFGSPTISYSEISNNSGFGINDSGSIRCCNIIDNGGGIKGNPSYLRYSNLEDANYNIYLKTSTDVYAPYNWWGTTNTVTINQSIYDYYDDFFLGVVNYMPFQTSALDISNQFPVANAGPDQNATIGQIVYFNGNNSYDPYEDPLKFKWDFGDGISTGWRSNSIASHAYSNKGYYTVNLTVSDDELIDIDSCIIHIINQPPIADAGPDQNVTVNQIVYLDGSNSYDLDLDPLKYFWDYGDGKFSDHDNDGIPDYYENESAPVNISHSYSTLGNYTVTLTVSDGSLFDNDTCTIYVSTSGGGNNPPIADAGPDQNSTVNQTVYFDGSGSYDPDNDPLTYNWDFGDGGSTGWQSNCNSSHAYNASGNYTVTLYVKDGEFTDSDTCIVQVSGSWVGNHPPSITIIEPDGEDDYAGVSYIITWDDFDPDDNAMIRLYYDTDNSDFDGILIVEDINENDASDYYVWNTNTVPAGFYYIYAQINDGINDPKYDYSEGPITISHSGPNHAPIADAGPDQTTTIGQVVNFDGSGSYDPDEDPLTYKWDFGDGTSTGWQNDWASSHTYDQPDNYLVTLTVSDGTLTDEDTCIIYVADQTGNHAPLADAGPDQTVNIEQTVHFDGSNSYDIDEDTLTYKWEFGDNTSTSWQSDSNGTHTYSTTGNYIAILTVNDGKLIDDDTCYIFVTGDDVNVSTNDTDADGLPDDWELEHGLNPEDANDAALDPDGDSLSNLAEFQHGTDPNNQDTDEDGMPDGWEIEYDLVPTDAQDALSDFDSDSLSNLKEYQIGTNPLDKDTDGDGYTDNIDAYPTNAERHKKKVDDNNILEIFTIIFFVMIIVIILIVMAAVIFKNKRKIDDEDLESDQQFNGRHEIRDGAVAQELQQPEDPDLEPDKIIDDLKAEALSPRKPSSSDLSDQELLDEFEHKYRDGKITESTYNVIQDRLGNK